MLQKGRVVKSTGSWVSVCADTDGDIIQCKMKGKLRLSDIRSTSPVAVGDIVDMDITGPGNTGVIESIYPRKNYIVRKASNLSKESHILAANLDQAFIIVTLVKPKTSLEFVDRFLVSAKAYGVPVVIIFNKKDLYGADEIEQLAVYEYIYRNIGYNTLSTSIVSSENIDKVSDLLKDKVTLISGNSGVGKSSLVNAVDPSCNLKTGIISTAHLKGKHTTTFAEMYRIGNGGYIVDTPGIKGFGMVHLDREEIYHFFPEIFEESSNCQYHNCLHLSEPKCAVIQAVEDGRISWSRYASYLSIMEEFEDDNKYRPMGY